MSNTTLRRDNRYFDVSPRIVAAGGKTTVTIRPLFEHVRFDSDTQYQVHFVPMEGPRGQTTWGEDECLLVSPRCGSLRFDHVFPVEQEYSVAIGLANSADVRQIAELRLFALDDDLLGRR
ncbi:MAG: hypothetical protein MUQ10_03395, partial [Anaerolineae bacterium]|nr:hypothetical protein [Anaerolineae bacterium]